MKGRSIVACILALASLVFAMVASVETAAAQERGMSPSSPASIGTPVNSTLELGAAYDVKVTVLEVVRGKEALERIKAASASNKPPKAGHEFILARVAFELQARGAPADRTFELGRPFQFAALSADGREYEAVSPVAPKPELGGKVLRSGDKFDGWVAFQVQQGDGKPIMAFDPASGGAMLRGRVLFFQLY
jgi:hypothetical protein